MPLSYGELAAQRPTGRVRGRQGWFGRIVLQIEILSPRPHYPKPPRPGPYDPWANGSFTFWRDAMAEDLFRPVVREPIPMQFVADGTAP